MEAFAVLGVSWEPQQQEHMYRQDVGKVGLSNSPFDKWFYLWHGYSEAQFNSHYSYSVVLQMERVFWVSGK